MGEDHHSNLATNDLVNVLCMKWGNKYPADYVNRLYSMVARNMQRPFRFINLCEIRFRIEEAAVDPVLQRLNAFSIKTCIGPEKRGLRFADKSAAIGAVAATRVESACRHVYNSAHDDPRLAGHEAKRRSTLTFDLTLAAAQNRCARWRWEPRRRFWLRLLS